MGCVPQNKEKSSCEHPFAVTLLVPEECGDPVQAEARVGGSPDSRLIVVNI